MCVVEVGGVRVLCPNTDQQSWEAPTFPFDLCSLAKMWLAPGLTDSHKTWGGEVVSQGAAESEAAAWSPSQELPIFSTHKSSLFHGNVQSLAHAASLYPGSPLSRLLPFWLCCALHSMQWRPALHRQTPWQKANEGKIHFLSLFPSRYSFYFQQILPLPRTMFGCSKHFYRSTTATLLN